MWLLGAALAAAGTAVYIELGTVRDMTYSCSCATVAKSEICYLGLASERRRKELSRVYVPAPKVSDHMCICCVCLPDGMCLVGSSRVPFKQKTQGMAAANSVVFSECKWSGYASESFSADKLWFLRSNTCPCHTLYMVHYSFDILFYLNFHRVDSRNNAQVGRPIAKCSWFIQTRRTLSRCACWPAVSSRCSRFPSQRSVWATSQFWMEEILGRLGDRRKCLRDRNVQRHLVNFSVLAFLWGFMLLYRSFVGYNNANYTLSEVKNPVQTLKRAAPIAMCLVTLVYLFVNIAYFAVVSKDDILNSQQIVA